MITDIDNMSVQRWYKLHNSFENGNPDWTLLYLEKPTKINKTQAEKLYQDLIFQMPQIKAESLCLLLRLNQETEKFALTKILHEQYNEETPNLQDCENAFGDYFMSLKNDFENFISYNYSITDNYLQTFKDIFKFELPDVLKKSFSSNFAFMHPAQLFEYANSLDCEISQRVLISDLFFEKLIIKTKANISLDSYFETIRDYHISRDGYEKWILLRPSLLNFADFDKDSSDEKHFTIEKMYEIIFGLETFSKVQIDPKKDSIVKFNTFLNLANKQAESQKLNSAQ